MQSLEALHLLDRDLLANFAQQGVDEQPTTHANSAMDSPYGELDTSRLEGLPPGENVLVDAVDKGAVEIEEERRPVHESVNDEPHPMCHLSDQSWIVMRFSTDVTP